MSLDLTATGATVEILFDGGSADAATIWRSTAGGSRQVVRGADAADTSGGVLYVVDDEAPFGQTVYYEAVGWIADAEDSRESSSITLDVTDVWLKAPGRADKSRAVDLAWFDFAETLPARRGVFDVIGARHPVVVSDTRGGRVCSLTISTTTAAEASAILALVNSAPTILFEPPVGHQIQRGYFAIGDVTASVESHSPGEHITTWTLPLVEVAAPSGGSATVTATWADLVDAYPGTWQDIVDAHDTWLSLIRSL